VAGKREEPCENSGFSRQPDKHPCLECCIQRGEFICSFWGIQGTVSVRTDGIRNLDVL